MGGWRSAYVAEVILATGKVITVPRASMAENGALHLRDHPSSENMVGRPLLTLAPGAWIAYREVRAQ